MKRLAIGLSIAAITVTVLVTAAAAAPPGFCGPDGTNPDHPSCPTSPNSTTTTQPVVTEICESAFTVTGPREVVECDWTPQEGETPLDTATLEATILKGEVSRLVVFVRDSSPGDICVLAEWDQPADNPLEASFPLIYESESYWQQPTHWCHRFDPIDGIRDDLNGEPLRLLVNLRAKKGTTVSISLTP